MGWFGLMQHDTCGERKRRIPVQWLEIAWWLAAGGGLFWLRAQSLPPGSHALAGLGWYGLGRFWLEPLRERTDKIRGVRTNQLIAALLALVTSGWLLMLLV